MTARRLHLGCFDQPTTGWINTDITPHVWVSRVPYAAAALSFVGKMDDRRLQQHKDKVFRSVKYMNVGKKFPFEDGSIEAIFSSHLLEHLPLSTARSMLRECARVLKPDGVMRIGVPDLDIAVALFDRQDPNLFLDTIFEGTQTGKNSHRWMYNESSLSSELLRAGFGHTVRRSFQIGVCPDVKVLDNRPEITLFMECFTSVPAPGLQY